jgi:hypothetical protein
MSKKRKKNENVSKRGNGGMVEGFNPILAGAEANVTRISRSSSTSTEPDNNDLLPGYENRMLPFRQNSANFTGMPAPLRRGYSAPFSERPPPAHLSRSLSLPFIKNSGYLESRPLGRTISAGERRNIGQLVEELEPSQNFYSAPASQNSEYSIGLERYESLSSRQSPLRFVLYTSDVEIARRFTSRETIQIRHNSLQNIPLTVVFLNRIAHEERADIIRRLPESVQHLSQSFTEGQFKNSITLPNYFLLTIEEDTTRSEANNQLSKPPTSEIFGVLCCSEETATRNSSDFVDSAGARLVTSFDTTSGYIYTYVHLFTYLSSRTLGNRFFTGSLMLEGLYDLFNPIRDERIIYLEAIRVQATLDFYNRFGMEELSQMTLTSSNPINPPILVYFDPFKGFVVPDEIPYVLTSREQIVRAAGVAHTTRRTRANATAQTVQASIDPSRLRQISPQEALELEQAVFDFFEEKARHDPRGPRS